MNKHIYFIIGLLIGLLISGISVYGAGKLYANSIDVDTSKMSELGETSNVNLALNYLYGKAASITKFSNISDVPEISSSNSGVLAILYMDPTNLKICTKEAAISTTGTKEGCMKWYIYKEDSDKYYAILDHNTTAKVAWGAAKSSGPTYATIRLNNDTSNWVKTGNNALTVRLITAAEIAQIVKLDAVRSWNQAGTWFYLDSLTLTQEATSKGASRYAWLFDYTDDTSSPSRSCYEYGCNVDDNSTDGYWTSSPFTSSGFEYAWGVDYEGRLVYLNLTNSAFYGVRPVIEIPKTLLD